MPISSSSFRLFAAASATVLSLSLADPAYAVPPMFDDEAATYSGKRLLEQTALNPEAEARSLEASGRSAITADLAAARQVLTGDIKVFGKAKSVRLSEETHFIGCIMARYRINYANGSRDWVLHFRQSPKGLVLDTIEPVSS